ncbi:MAG: DEAD/DEAH box helicase family protein [Clostridiales bacterium]|nr:DEAD/DEAH box helicase family protein [Clostridiales bacterium]
MATGAGEIYTATTAAYRLLKYRRMNRVLFLLDTKSLGAQV